MPKAFILKSILRSFREGSSRYRIAKSFGVIILALNIFFSGRCITMANSTEYKNEGRSPNRLIHEKSPYLLQHAYNPVDWYPWGDEAFEKARQEDKSIFLSIGYSTCHWCHVMEHESFEDPEVARLMNATFISIKVDREERPDLDHVYMTVAQMLTGKGGWPLTIIMTPDKKPFYAATYLPKESRWGHTGMMELIPQIKSAWQTRRQEILSSSEKIINALQRMGNENPGANLDPSIFDKAYQDLAQRFDMTYGGFSDAPKFPTPHNLLFLMRYWKRSGDGKSLEMVNQTLREMRLGGIYDQIGFGFHRYATDKEWLVPHFEKMLYDQALLAIAYLEAYQATGEETYAATAREIFTYVIRDMTAHEGGFYSAEDADSEGVEGKFYVWTEQEIREILKKDEADLFIRVFNIQPKGNFKEEAIGQPAGTNILHLKKSIAEIATHLKMPAPELKGRIESARKELYDVRAKRVHPHKDDKILTDWNGLMIAALARGAQILGEPEYARTAQKAVRFILDQLRNTNGRLLHRYRAGEAKIVAHLDDYAFFIWGLIELYEASFEAGYLRTALELAEDMQKHFWDHKTGGFFFTPDDGESLIVRKKEVYDGALPSGNAVAMHNLLRLARFTGRSDLDAMASKIDNAFSEQIKQFPSGYGQFLTSVDFGIGPSYEVVIAGPPGGKDTIDMLTALRKTFIPNRVVIFRPLDENASEIDALAGFIKKHEALDGKATAYVCVEHFCKLPTTDINEMLNMLK